MVLPEVYPEEMRRREWLEYCCKHFGTVEINANYYHMPRAKVCASWRERTPPGLRFTMKMNGEITHGRRLAGCEKLLASPSAHQCHTRGLGLEGEEGMSIMVGGAMGGGKSLWTYGCPCHTATLRSEDEYAV